MRMQDWKNRLLIFLSGYPFTKGLLISTSAFIAIYFCVHFFTIAVAVVVAKGIILSSIADIPGNKKHHLLGMLASIGLALLNFAIIHLVYPLPFLLIPTLGILTFANAYLAVYGFRASLVSFVGLLALIISFSQPLSDIDVLYNLLYMSAGGLWYISVTLLFRGYRSKIYRFQLLRNCMHLLAAYLKLKNEKISAKNKQALQNKLTALQNEITLNHEDIRNILLHKNRQAGITSSIENQITLFITLVDMFELAIAQPRYVASENQHAEYARCAQALNNVMQQISERLERLSQKSYLATNYNSNEINNSLSGAKNAIMQYERLYPNAREDSLYTLSTTFDFAENQLKKLQKIELLVVEKESIAAPISRKEQDKFLVVQDYGSKIWFENFNFQSPIFKHSIRLAVTVLFGYFIGILFPLQKAYWIILTVVVIMRPGYVLTKQRSIYRTVGTIAGALLSTLIVLFTQNFLVYGIIIFITNTLAFAFIQQNYKAFSAFITITMLLVFAMLMPDPLLLVKYRVVDTLIGVSLSSFANYFLWPAWEIKSIKTLIVDALRNNHRYFRAVRQLLTTDAPIDSNYRLSRKEAFIALNNLQAGVERIEQEPKSKQQGLETIQELARTYHSFISSLAAWSTHVQLASNPAESEKVERALEEINQNLLACEVQLNAQIIRYSKTNDKHGARKMESKAALKNQPPLLLNENQNNELEIELTKELNILLSASRKMFLATKNFTI